MKCGFCGYEFEAEAGSTNCPGCPLRGHCGYIRCPRCGFDNPREAVLVRLIREWINQRRETRKRPINGRDPRLAVHGETRWG